MPVLNLGDNFMLGSSEVDSLMLGADSLWARIPPFVGTQGYIYPFAGNGTSALPSDGADAATSPLQSPRGVAHDGDNTLYISSDTLHRVFKVNISTGTITRIAGTGTGFDAGDGGDAGSASLNAPWGLLYHDNYLYVASAYGHTVRRINLSTNIIDTFAGTGTGGYSGDTGQAATAQLHYPANLSHADGWIYIGDSGNNRIRRVSLTTGLIETVFGSGTAASSGDGQPAVIANVNSPNMAIVASDGKLYVTDTNGHKIRAMSFDNGIAITYAGIGTAGSGGDDSFADFAQLNRPMSLVDPDDGYLYICDSDKHKIRRISWASGFIEAYAGTGTGTMSGDDGPATSAALQNPTGITAGGGFLWIADTANNRVRRVYM